ncbi:hypothetical protein [Streptomyces sp. TLI_053]|uniref:hypothetical protein n=1 Tax=Streptomyces sp. TLI_053 TaxID=1855352 RepID=UPI0013520C32|nr:hypothetical protein [Streptomyces sp. TLI_053]
MTVVTTGSSRCPLEEPARFPTRQIQLNRIGNVRPSRDQYLIVPEANLDHDLLIIPSLAPLPPPGSTEGDEQGDADSSSYRYRDGLRHLITNP